MLSGAFDKSITTSSAIRQACKHWFGFLCLNGLAKRERVRLSNSWLESSAGRSASLQAFIQITCEKREKRVGARNEAFLVIYLFFNLFFPHCSRNNWIILRQLGRKMYHRVIREKWTRSQRQHLCWYFEGIRGLFFVFTWFFQILNQSVIFKPLRFFCFCCCMLVCFCLVFFNRR